MTMKVHVLQPNFSNNLILTKTRSKRPTDAIPAAKGVTEMKRNRRTDIRNEGSGWLWRTSVTVFLVNKLTFGFKSQHSRINVWKQSNTNNNIVSEDAEDVTAAGNNGVS